MNATHERWLEQVCILCEQTSQQGTQLVSCYGLASAAQADSLAFPCNGSVQDMSLQHDLSSFVVPQQNLIVCTLTRRLPL